MKRLEQIYDEFSSCVRESPGNLTEAQISSVSQSLNEIKAKVEQFQSEPVKKDEDSMEEKQVVEQSPPPPQEVSPARKQKDEFESLTLSEMRSLLKLDAISEKHSTESDQAIHDAILEEINNSTSQLYNMGNELHQRVVLSNQKIDKIQDLQERNITSVNKENKKIGEMTSSSWCSIFYLLRMMALALLLLFVGFVLVVLF